MDTKVRRLHSEDWWSRLVGASDRLDEAILVEGLGDLVVPHIGSPLLRREVEIATITVTRHLEKPANTDVAEQAAQAVSRLTETIERINERSTGSTSTEEAAVVLLALRGNYAAAAAAAEPTVGTTALQRLVVTALRLERFDTALAMRLLDAGQAPETAIRSGSLIGQYRWWPSWLLRIITERALAGTLDEETIAALDNCAYAALSPMQAHLARKLLGGDPQLLADAAYRLEGMGEADAAERLRQGDLNMVALAARLMSV